MERSHTTLRNVALFGAGQTGVGLARYLVSLPKERVSSITLFTGANTKASRELSQLEAEGVQLVCNTEQVSGHFDLGILSPGIPETSSFFAAARAASTELISEPEFAWRESPKRWLAITGTNGKTTTTTLLTQLLQDAGMQACAVGNIGRLATGELLARSEESWFVAELSSFQLAECKEFHPRAAALLNITPDHLGWHGSIEAYAQAKEAIFSNLDAHELAVVVQNDSFCEAIIERLVARGQRVCVVSSTSQPSTTNAAYVRNNKLYVRLAGTEQLLCAQDELLLEGRHNIENVLCACALALEVGVDLASVTHTLKHFSALEHRVEPAGELNGIRFINDSKATNVDAVLKALESFEAGKIVLMVGGHDKMTDLVPLIERAQKCCKAVVCFGEARERFAQEFRAASAASSLDQLKILEAEHLSEALDVAIAAASSKDVVLLSPACSSFDEFSSFEERGKRFKELVVHYLSKKDVS